jgi:hypothetical protein
MRDDDVHASKVSAASGKPSQGGYNQGQFRRLWVGTRKHRFPWRPGV